MIRYLATLALLVVYLTGTLPGAPFVNSYAFPPAGGGGGPALLFHETFDTTGTSGPGGTGYDLAWTETAAGGTLDENEATIFAGASGESLRIVSAGTNDNTYREFTAGDQVFVMFMWRYSSLTGATQVLALQAAGGSGMRGGITTSGAGVLSVSNGASSQPITDAVPANQWVYIWYEYVRGPTAVTGEARGGWSTTTTRPTSGTKWQQVLNGTATTAVGRLVIGNAATETHTHFVDEVKISAIGYPVP